MRAAVLLAALLVTGCTGFRGGVERVDAKTTAESWGRHHTRCVAGPVMHFAGGASIYVYGGRQFATYAPGEPAYSNRAPSDEWQGGVECSVPVWRRK